MINKIYSELDYRKPFQEKGYRLFSLLKDQNNEVCSARWITVPRSVIFISFHLKNKRHQFVPLHGICAIITFILFFKLENHLTKSVVASMQNF